MTERIIYCLLSCMTALADLPHREVLRLDDGIVASVPDETFLNLLAGSTPPLLLYYSTESYEDAVRGLAPAEIEEVVRKRLGEWAPSPLSDSLDWLYGRGRQCLSLAALSRASASGSAAAAIDKHIESGLELMSTMVGGALYADVDLSFMLRVALENEAELVAELNAAQAEVPAEAPDAESRRREIDRHVAYAKHLGDALAARGQEEFQGALPFVDLVRVVFITPRDDRVIARLKVLFLPYITWKDGLVAEWRLREMGMLEASGKTVLVLYLNRGEFAQDLSDLTEAQRRRTFERRAAMSSDERSAAWRDYLNGKRLELTLFRREVQSRASESDSTLAAVLQDQIAEETKALVSELADGGSWLPSLEGPPESHLERLKSCEQAWLQNAETLQALARSRQDPLPERHLGEIVARNRERLAEIAPVIE
jgi:hypothetical protein